MIEKLLASPKEIFRVAKFLTVGGVGVLLNITILYLTVELFNTSYLIGAAAAVVIITTYKYLHNNHWSFGDRKLKGTKHISSFSKFVLVIALYHAVYFGLLILFTEVLSIYYVISALLAILISLVPHYTLCWRWVWKGQQNPLQ